jgi:UDP-2,3-diacylglucosamine pyrophosphatase LpxH
MHARLLSTLQGIADVRLVAALKDDRLGYPGANDLRIFVPDVHLISDARQQQGGFQYFSNHTDLLTEVFIALAQLRQQAAPAANVSVYCIGDLLDLWREAPGFAAGDDAAACIRDSHEDLIVAALSRDLQARFLLGNHDFNLYHWPAYTAWERRFYLPDTTAEQPRVMLVHGDIFDWIESFPTEVKQILVYLFSPNAAPNTHALGQMEALALRAHAGRTYQQSIQAPQPLHLGALRRMDGDPVPPRWNVQTPGQSPPEILRYLAAAAAETAARNTEFNLDLRLMVIGHTHFARIAVQEDADSFFVLMDCGAWIEQCAWDEDGQTITALSAQLGALCDNELRLYQLAPRA